MHTTNLRKVGGSVMLVVPPAILDILHLKAGAAVGVTVDGNRLVIEPSPRPRYTLDELLAQCDASMPMPKGDKDWTTGPAAGRELL
jgi:antitoxin ChpS